MTISLYGGNLKKKSLDAKISGSNLCLEKKGQVSTIKIGTPIQFGQFGPNMAQIWPNLVQLTHFVTGVGSSNLTYALTVVINFRNVL